MYPILTSANCVVAFLASEEVRVSPLSQPSASAAAPTAAAVPPTVAQSPAISQASYSQFSLESGQKERVFVSWMLHPGCFWLQKDGCEDVLASMASMAEEVGSTLSSVCCVRLR